LKLPFYPGCTLKTTARCFEESALASAEVLGIELVELPRWNCCGTVHALVKDDVMHHLAPIRVLLRVEEAVEVGLVNAPRLITLCAMCYNTLKRANSLFREDEDKRRIVGEIMERENKPYQGSVEVLHLLELLQELGWEKISERMERPLESLRVAPYYGCLLLRPRGFGIDDPDEPRVLSQLLEALGAEVVDMPFKSRCCGAYHSVFMKEEAAELSYKILRQAVEMKADLIALSCPLCEFNMARRQSLISRLHRDFKPIPVLYFTQLLALAFGLDKKASLEENTPDPRPLLRRRALWR
jgi:heterodisulfide reductase subunit B